MSHRRTFDYRPTFQQILWFVLLHAGGILHSVATADWPQWRGPTGTGAAPTGTPPLEWSTEKNILWKTKLAGRGHASPVVSGDMVFLSTSIPVGKSFPQE